MTTTKPIHELLGMTPQVYELDYTERYIRWCMDKAEDITTDLQKIMANSSVSKFYNYEHSKIESQFVKAVAHLNGTDIKVIRAIYSNMIAQVFMRYPSALFEDARKLCIINQN